MSISRLSFCKFSSTLRHSRVFVSAETAGTSGRITRLKPDDVSFILFLRDFFVRVLLMGRLGVVDI